MSDIATNRRAFHDYHILDRYEAGISLKGTEVKSIRAGLATLNGAFAANVITAQGAASGIQHAHKTGTIKLATFDADPTQMSMMKSGTIQLAIAQEPALEGSDGVQQALNATEGKSVTKNIATPLFAITPQNMNSAAAKPYIYESSCGS